MNIKHFLSAVLVLTTTATYAQKKAVKLTQTATSPQQVARPKLVVGMVVDQMRWDYLYRYYSRYTNGGFKRLTSEGFSAENTLIPYTPTITACGHTCVYTGSVPAIHGIIGNNWYDPTAGRDMYCTEDNNEKTVGSTSNAGQMSPRNMLTNTIGDELRMSNNFQSKVIGVALKDRGAILPAGHSANAAYWYDGVSGNWITSTYYMSSLPDWVNKFNDQKLPTQYLSKDWNTLYPLNTYTLSTADDKNYEGKFKFEEAPVFPHLTSKQAGKDNGLIRSTPFGNTMTLEFAKSAIEANQLGKGKVTDFLAVSLSSTDYVGHQFGPNSIEAEDTYLRLDKDLEAFFNYLDKTIGKGQYLFFITADHGVAHVPGYLTENKMPGGTLDESQYVKDLNTLLEGKFDVKKPILTTANDQIVFNRKNIDKTKVDFAKMKEVIIDYLRAQPGIANVIDLNNLQNTTLTEPMKTMLANGYNAQRSGDLQIINQPGWFDGHKTGTTHGAWNPYDAHIPLVFMGWNVKQGHTNKVYHMTDISATVAAMLHIQMPNGCIGKPITEITNKN